MIQATPDWVCLKSVSNWVLSKHQQAIFTQSGLSKAHDNFPLNPLLPFYCSFLWIPRAFLERQGAVKLSPPLHRWGTSDMCKTESPSWPWPFWPLSIFFFLRHLVTATILKCKAVGWPGSELASASDDWRVPYSPPSQKFTWNEN